MKKCHLEGHKQQWSRQKDTGMTEEVSLGRTQRAVEQTKRHRHDGRGVTWKDTSSNGEDTNTGMIEEVSLGRTQRAVEQTKRHRHD